MIRFLRKIWRLLLAALWFPLMGLVALPGLFMKREGIRRNARVARHWAAGCARILGMKIHVHGDPSKFAGGMIVSNHQGYLDILTEASIFPIRFAAKAEIKSWFLLGPYLTLSRAVWVDRSSRQKAAEVAEEMERTLADNVNMLVYPEGTSSAGDGDLLPFKSTAFEALCHAGRPFLPILLKYHIPDDERELAWYGSMNMLPHFWHVLGQPRIDVEVHILPEITPIPGETRKELTERTYRIMNDKYRSIA